ncbi:hypothetical protein BO71DRAFT_475457 [Aspergillus ellipticus CBS 707.79]|uniref:RanBD1 domain-containing protein n=1 Tax=Aspergillus ellipticus CBS 707.79 TaxID=1448320 RepID=A0A319EU79_9EURO|nr:hypothetical protein BO71DRAFT_475457 [Aspergillus ellipticus CBS 707.79]
MSKRTAQGPQGDKDSNLFEFNMSSTPEDKPQRATAAQLANRKIKDVRRRTRPNTAAPGAPAPSFGGPFSSIDPNTVSSTPASSQPPSSGFSFGQNQSFPGASSTPSQSNQNGTSSPFAFGSGGGGGGSSSFNFSSSFGGPAASNPFANMNNGSAGQSDTGGFNGFKGSMFNIPPAASPAPTQQALPSGSLFDTPSQQNTSTGNLFGNSTSNGPSVPSAAATPTTGGLFGQTNAASTPSTNMFGHSTFGNDSMQTSPDAKNNAAQSKPSVFGSAPPSQPAFGGTTTSFSSPGSTSFFGATASSAAETPSKPVFDFKAATSTPTLFGGATPQPASAATPAASTPVPAAATTATSSSSIFGTASPAKPSTPFQNPFQSSNLFQTAPSTAQKPAEEKKDEPKPADTGPSLFSTGEGAGSASPAAPSTGLFQTPPAKNLFEPKPAATTEPEKPKAAGGNPFGNMFAKPATPSQPATEQKSLPGSTPFQGLFSQPSTSTDAAKSSEVEKPATPGPFSFTPSSASPQASNIFSPKPPAPTPATEPVVQAPLTSFAPSESPFKVNGAKPVPSAPATGNGTPSTFERLQTPKLSDKTDKQPIGDSETLYRLRVLNECFQRQVSKLDPSSDNFDAVLQFYTRVRATLGASVGSKRKATDDESNGASPKRVRPFGQSSGKATSPKENSSTPTSHKRKSIDEGDNGSPTKRVNGDSTTASIFAQSFSKSKTSESDDEPVNAAPSVKPTGSSAGSAPAAPKFGSANGTDFMAQFRAQSAKDAEKEKAKRKAEDFDSDEEDEAEWERRDAEEQRKKQEQFGTKAPKQAKFVPGKGFVFDDEPSDSVKKPEDTTASLASAGASVFASKSNSTTKSNNIFGHLSATPSEAEDDDNDADDTEEASTPDGEPDDSAESSREISNDEPKTSEKETGSRSLFDRVSYDDDGKPKRQGEEEQKSSMSTFFGSSKFSSSFNSTPTSLTPVSSSDSIQSASAAKPTTTNIFGATSTTSNIFGSALSGSGNSTPSIFNTNATGDNTWKPNSPIKFATDSASTSKPDSGLATPVPEAPKPFSNLFGAPPTLTKSSDSKSTPSLGFSFGAPAQSNSSLLAPPVFSSAAASRSSTPGGTSDTGAEESGDGEAAENLPQVDLARGGAGEENEDLVTENRARAMKHTSGAGWESQGVGFLRILKDRTTSRGRILVRADPSGNVILNARLMKEIKYSVAKNSVQFLVPQPEGPPQLWALRVKTSTDAESLSKFMEETKS